MSGSGVVPRLVEDLRAEHRELWTLLASLEESDWTRPTPAVGWDVKAQVSHLAFFDETTRSCIAEPDAFVVFSDELGDGLQDYVDEVAPQNDWRSGSEMLRWWREAHESLVGAALAADPAVRVPWFGPSMSLASKVTARIMETWAHGQDVMDAVGVTREPTQRLAHVARIGVLAMPNSFRTRGLDVPTTPVLVDLEAPDGTRWTWGDPDADDVVRGPAQDFCLVVTQRRHPSDTHLTAIGPVAEQWVSIAQAFAGPAGTGREPGQFTRSTRTVA